MAKYRTVRTKEEILAAIDQQGGNWRKVCKALKVGEKTLKRLVAEHGIDFAPLAVGVKQTLPLKLALWKIKKDYEGSRREFSLEDLCEEVDCYFGAKYTEGFTVNQVKKAWEELRNVEMRA